MNPYAVAFAALAKAYKIAKGVSPKGLDLLKLKQQAKQKAIDAQKVIKVNFDKGNNWMKNQSDRIKQYNRQNKESAQRFKEKMKKEKSLGEKLKDYDGDPDLMRDGGRVGYAVGGRTQNLIGTYQDNPTLQDQYTQQGYLDLFDLNANQFTPTTQSAPASSNTSTPQGILTPNIVKPLIIPGSESDGGGGITNIDRGLRTADQYGFGQYGNNFNTADVQKEIDELQPNILQKLLDKSLVVKAFKKGQKVLKGAHQFGLDTKEKIDIAIAEAKAKRQREANAKSVMNDLRGTGTTPGGQGFGYSGNTTTSGYSGRSGSKEMM